MGKSAVETFYTVIQEFKICRITRCLYFIAKFPQTISLREHKTYFNIYLKTFKPFDISLFPLYPYHCLHVCFSNKMTSHSKTLSLLVYSRQAILLHLKIGNCHHSILGKISRMESQKTHRHNYWLRTTYPLCYSNLNL